ncbi:glycosyltransferase, partial [Patescibacteria group bacterium]|nr:glycosyltransferase [Patescibacteria group bacterium]
LISDFIARSSSRKFREQAQDFNFFYNEQIFPFDHGRPAYKRIYFIKKDERLKNLPLKQEPLDNQLILEAIAKAMSLLTKIHSAKTQQIVIKRENIKNLSQNVHKKEQELFEIKTSLRWKVPNYLYKLYKGKIKKFIPKAAFRLASPLTGYLKSLGQKSRFKNIADPKAVQGLNFKKINNIRFKLAPRPRVSIIIPVFNQWQFTYHCLRSLKAVTREISTEIIIVDNGSTDQTSKLFSQKIKNVKYLRNKKNPGFVRGCNQGAAAAKGEFLVFLNNDTQALPGWLEALIKTFEMNKSAGLVGSKLIYPDGRLQESGGIVYKNKAAANFGRRENPDNYEFNYLKEADYCSGASIMIKKKLFQELGGFDKRYAPAYFEDTDLAMKVRRAGKKVFYQPLSEVVHFEGVTAGTDTDKGFKKYQKINKDKFFKRWQKILDKENSASYQDEVFLARDRSKNKKVILFIDYMVPAYDKEAGHFIVFHYLKILKKLGHKIIFWPHNLARIEPYTQELQQLGIETVYGNVSFKNFIQQSGRFIDFSFISRPQVAEEFIDPIKKYTDSKIIYLAHDLHFLRKEREVKITKNRKAGQLNKKEKQKEIRIMEKAHVSLFFSGKEVKILRKQAPQITAQTIPWIQPANAPPDFDYSRPRSGVFFVGSKHPPNIDGIKWFYEKVWPLVKKNNPDIVVKVAGNGLDKALSGLASKNFQILGFVKDLDPFFKSSKIFISPLRYGAGIKGKILLAMSYGLPVVTTSIGAEGIGLKNNKSALIADSPQEFAEKIKRLYTDQELWKKVSKNSLALIRENYSEKKAQERIREILKNK